MKRLVFSLLYDSGAFILSRNFRRQKIGTIDWLMSNYHFQDVSYGLDEILLINISKTPDHDEDFLSVIRAIAKKCFIPLTIGGRINQQVKAQKYFSNGADKVFINSSLFTQPDLSSALSDTYGKQAVVGGINFMIRENLPVLCDSLGRPQAGQSFTEHLLRIVGDGVGELILQSVDQDGTGNGLAMEVLDHVPHSIEVPLVLMGGIGKAEHIISGLKHAKIDAVATANLLNFIGQSFVSIRQQAIDNCIMLPKFNHDIIL
tara:strand:- start:7813 stop:8592 length:780 start_codon:yes stop_codon:yes gene_type:complete